MLKREATVLVVIDIQGKLARLMHDSERVIHQAGILMQGMSVLGVPVLVTEQYPKGLGPTVDELQPILPASGIIEKAAFSCCAESSFMDRLHALQRPQVLVCGIETHVCVYQTVRDLLEIGFHPHLVTDAVSSRTSSNRELAIRKMETMGAQLTGTEMALFELLGVSGTEEFKAISRLVK